MIKKIFKRILLGVVSLIILIVLSIMAFIKTSPQFGSSPAGTHLEKIGKSKNFSQGKFVNLIPTAMDLDLKSGLQVMYDMMFKTEGRKPSQPLPVQFNNRSKIVNDTLAEITWYGHSAIFLQLDGKNILIDPMLGNAASPVPFMTKRFEYKTPINLESIDSIDAVILSHDHYDHLDYPSIIKLKDKVDHFYAPLGVGAHLVRWGIDELKITELDWWENSFIDDIQIVATPARHFSGRGISDRNKTQWASWVIIGKQEKIYFSGDSGYGPHFNEIGDKYGPFDFAMMECGQYNEKWEAIHMLPEQTIQASLDVKSKSMMPIHWSAFNLSLHTWTDPVERAVKAANIQGVNIITPLIGERFSPGNHVDGSYWWRDLK